MPSQYADIETLEKNWTQQCDTLFDLLSDHEVLFCSLNAERSQFTRLNHNRVRQNGQVDQAYFTMHLYQKSAEGMRHASKTLNAHEALANIEEALQELGELVATLPIDPHAAFVEEKSESRRCSVDEIIENHENCFDHDDCLSALLLAHKGLDTAGILASGHCIRALRSSLGHNHWHEVPLHIADWSCHLPDKQASSRLLSFPQRSNNADYTSAFTTAANSIRQDLELFSKPAQELKPGKYRAFLGPDALQDILAIASYQGFSERLSQTGQSLLQKLSDGKTLHKDINLSEDFDNSYAPRFADDGSLADNNIPLITDGKFASNLCSLRSAQEYGSTANASSEGSQALSMAAGATPEDELLTLTGTGLYIGNTWYTNCSDREHARITGLTRFSCFWIEDGRLVAPLPTMRFDVSIYNLLGDDLIAIGDKVHDLPANSSYSQRYLGGMRLPSIVVDNFPLTL